MAHYGWKIYPLANAGGRSALFLAFLGAAGLGEGDVENDRDLWINSKVVLHYAMQKKKQPNSQITWLCFDVFSFISFQRISVKAL